MQTFLNIQTYLYMSVFILYAESFKKYAKDNNMTIETLDWSIKPDDKSSENHNDPIVEEAPSAVGDDN